MKKIEHSILIFILIEAIFTLLFFKLTYIEILLGFALGFILIIISNLIPKNTFFKFRLLISSIIIGGYLLIKITYFIKNPSKISSYHVLTFLKVIYNIKT